MACREPDSAELSPTPSEESESPVTDPVNRHWEHGLNAYLTKKKVCMSSSDYMCMSVTTFSPTTAKETICIM